MTQLDDLLTTLNVRVNTFALCKIERGWGLMLEGMDQPRIHYVLQGAGLVRLPGRPPVPVKAHDFVIIPKGQSQRLEVPDGVIHAIKGTEICVTAADGILEMRAGERADLVTACGIIEASYGWALGLFDRLDRPLLEPLEEGSSLRQAWEALLTELMTPTLGSRALSEALLKQCIVLLVRRMIGSGGDIAWLAQAVDPRLMSAVMAMLENPAQDFTLPGLADLAGMSRSSFAAHFTNSFGLPAIEFLKRVRLRYAAHLLQSSDLPIAIVARSVGFESRSYFSRAFRAAFGIDPQTYRAQHRERRAPGSGTGSDEQAQNLGL